MLKKTCLLIIIILFMTALPGCQSDTVINQYSDEVLLASGPILKSEKERITVPEISNGDRKKLVEGNMEFALDLYQQLAEDEGNFMFSPYSISSALAMTYAGANGTTADQMASTLRFELPETTLHQGFNNLDQALVEGNDSSESTGDVEGRLHIVNAVWGQENYEFRKSFLDTLAEHYGAGLRIVDYRDNTEEARITINEWVRQETEEKITELIPLGIITGATRLVLTNALYFKAAWQKPFSKESIGLRPFHLLNGNETEIYMMKQTNTFPYVEKSDYQALELPYNGQGISMVVILPSDGEFIEFERNLDLSQLRNILSDLDDEQVRLSIPKFKLESFFQLDKVLSMMGMPLAFDWIKADFTRMTTEKKEPLHIGTVLHQSFIDVDEKGTEATAATAVVMMTGAAPGTKPNEPKIMTVDRPFIFLIRDIETCAILFLGRVLNPDE